MTTAGPNPSGPLPSGLNTTGLTAGGVPSLLATAQSELSRLVDVRPGQRLQATVLSLPQTGQLVIGLLGGAVQASSNLALQVGRTYDFTVSQLSPQLVLTAAWPVSVVPSFATVAGSGLLGDGGGQLGAQLQQLDAQSRRLPKRAMPAMTDVRQLTQLLGRGEATGADLQALHQRLGHDQEVRLLRLSRAVRHLEQADPQGLQQTLKADLLRLAQQTDVPAEPARVAAELLQTLGGAEADNAARAEQGAPQTLPLPIPATTNFVRDARMFVEERDAQEGGDAEVRRGVRVVLLLDLTKLGPVRVDVDVVDDHVTARFRVFEQSTLEVLTGSRAELRAMLEEVGLTAAEVQVQKVTESLPVADLIRIPPSNPDALVDLHA